MNSTGPNRPHGLSVRARFTLSYVAFLLVTGSVMLGAAWLVGQYRGSSDIILRYVPDRVVAFVGRLVPGTHSFFLREFGPTAVLVLAILSALVLLSGWALAGRMLAPLTQITAATRKVATGSLSHRIKLEGRRDEFRELADAFDSMLSRLEAQVAEQQRFAANASHELRTPLAIAQTLLEVARNDRDRDTDALIDRLHSVISRAIDLTEALLLLSRAERRVFTPEVVDLSLVAEEAAETLLPLAESRGAVIVTSGETADALGSAALLQQLATNLMHNAIVHNLPDGGMVRVTTKAEEDSVLLVVENTGQLISTDAIAQLTEPFQRGHARIHSEHAGVGLGLAIAKSITQAHDGTLNLDPLETGGLKVTVRLPAIATRNGSIVGTVCELGMNSTDQRDRMNGAFDRSVDQTAVPEAV